MAERRDDRADLRPSRGPGGRPVDREDASLTEDGRATACHEAGHDGNREPVSQAVLPGTTFQRGEQRVLFAIGSSYYLGTDYTYFDISPDDGRFLMVRQKSAGVSEAPVMIVVENWMEEVKARVPN